MTGADTGIFERRSTINFGFHKGGLPSHCGVGGFFLGGGGTLLSKFSDVRRGGLKPRKKVPPPPQDPPLHDCILAVFIDCRLLGSYVSRFHY